MTNCSLNCSHLRSLSILKHAPFYFLKLNWTTMSMKWVVLASPLENFAWWNTCIPVCVVCDFAFDMGWWRIILFFEENNQVREVTVSYTSIYENNVYFSFSSFPLGRPCHVIGLSETAKFSSPRHIRDVSFSQTGLHFYCFLAGPLAWVLVNRKINGAVPGPGATLSPRLPDGESCQPTYYQQVMPESTFLYFFSASFPPSPLLLCSRFS